MTAKTKDLGDEETALLLVIFFIVLAPIVKFVAPDWFILYITSPTVVNLGWFVYQTSKYDGKA